MGQRRLAPFDITSSTSIALKIASLVLKSVADECQAVAVDHDSAIRTVNEDQGTLDAVRHTRNRYQNVRGKLMNSVTFSLMSSRPKKRFSTQSSASHSKALSFLPHPDFPQILPVTLSLPFSQVFICLTLRKHFLLLY